MFKLNELLLCSSSYTNNAVPPGGPYPYHLQKIKRQTKREHKTNNLGLTACYSYSLSQGNIEKGRLTGELNSIFNRLVKC